MDEETEVQITWVPGLAMAFWWLNGGGENKAQISWCLVQNSFPISTHAIVDRYESISDPDCLHQRQNPTQLVLLNSGHQPLQVALLGVSFRVQFMIKCTTCYKCRFSRWILKSGTQSQQRYVGVKVGNALGGHLCPTMNWLLIYLCYCIFKMGDAISNI